MDLVISILTSAFWVILAITILVFIHELGHFLTAKWFGMRVERFSIGFPPNLFGRQVGGTEYVVGATPLGGYVKISGMIDESLDTDYQESEVQPWEFRAKPVWQRIVVITAGVIFNVILAVAIFGGIRWSEGEIAIPTDNVRSVYIQDGSVAHDIGLRTGDRILQVNGNDFERIQQLQPTSLISADSLTFTVQRGEETKRIVGPPDIITRMSRAINDGKPIGFGWKPPLVGTVQKDSPADSAGLRTGDRIVQMEGDSIAFWASMTEVIKASEGRPLSVRWFRPDSLISDTSAVTASIVSQRPDGVVYGATIAPMKVDDEGGERYIFGITDAPSNPITQKMLYDEYGIQRIQYGFGEAMAAGVVETWENSVNIVVTLKRIVTGRDDLRENLGGPVAIAKITSDAAAAGPTVFWNIVGMLSITLAIMNILPVPALDGGQLVFLLYEGITRRRPSVRVRLVAQQVGMILLLGFMTFLIFNDILRL